ncbi:alpha-ketoglutarate-dependent dioxygenase AlkB [Rhodobacterales bacterium HKCCE2091]|nr:alpha-ketoglutarate-dependent dioxygenase AlkB [Rhodobacterales bacterium HKCCE2091]
MTHAPDVTLRGIGVHRGYLGPDAQRRLVAELDAVISAAPFRTPETRFGPMSVRMTSAGAYGWIADRRGYRYEPAQPDGRPWPPIPATALAAWVELCPDARAPECCLVNCYGAEARMGMHQDRDEADFSQPVLSISLGDDALFRVGNETRGGKTESLWLSSGDVLVMGGEARRLYHGIDRVRPGSSTLLPRGGRINLTLRVVT